MKKIMIYIDVDNLFFTNFRKLLLFVLYINHKVVYVVCILEKYVQGS